jgi:thiamine-phosphate pyrophosphorylase
VSAAIPARPFLYPIVDVATVGEERAVAVVGTLARLGLSLLQLRAKGLTDRRFLALARESTAAAHAHGARLLVNDRPDVARLAGADGVHLGQDDLPPADARTILGPAAIIGFSTHNLDQLAAAAGEPVDYLALGPVFPTVSKERPDPVVGLALLSRARALTTRPLVAIGGITRANAGAVVAEGVDGVAVIGDLLRASDLEAAVRELTAALAA